MSVLLSQSFIQAGQMHAHSHRLTHTHFLSHKHTHTHRHTHIYIQIVYTSIYIHTYTNMYIITTKNRMSTKNIKVSSTSGSFQWNLKKLLFTKIQHFYTQNIVIRITSYCLWMSNTDIKVEKVLVSSLLFSF